MLHEVAAGDLDLTHIVNPIRKMLRHVRFFEGEVLSVDILRRQVTVIHGFDQHTHALDYDHLVLALGSVTSFYDIPNLAETATQMKTLGDAIGLRNRLIEHLEEAATECAAKDREPLLTFVVAGGGFAPQETISKNGENPLLRHVKWAQMVCALGLGEPGTVGIRQAQKRLLELFCCFSQVDGTPALILLEKDSAKSCG